MLNTIEDGVHFVALGGLKLVVGIFIFVHVENPRSFTTFVHSVGSCVQAFKPGEEKLHQGGNLLALYVLLLVKLAERVG